MKKVGLKKPMVFRILWALLLVVVLSSKLNFHDFNHLYAVQSRNPKVQDLDRHCMLACWN
jgi:hypothetical protein